jgi:hypothetical protein
MMTKYCNELSNRALVLLEHEMSTDEDEILFFAYDASTPGPIRNYLGYIQWRSSGPGFDVGSVALCAYDTSLGEEILREDDLDEDGQLRDCNALVKGVLAIRRMGEDGNSGNHSVYWLSSGAIWAANFNRGQHSLPQLVCKIEPLYGLQLSQEKGRDSSEYQRLWSRADGDTTRVFGEARIGTASNGKWRGPRGEGKPISREIFESWMADNNLIGSANSSWLHSNQERFPTKLSIATEPYTFSASVSRTTELTKSFADSATVSMKGGENATASGLISNSGGSIRSRTSGLKPYGHRMRA